MDSSEAAPLPEQLEQALAGYREALAACRARGDRAGEGIILNNMAALYYQAGQAETALALMEQALALRREMGDRNGEAFTLYNMSFLVAAPRARELAGQARALWRALQSPSVQLADRRLAELRLEELTEPDFHALAGAIFAFVNADGLEATQAMLEVHRQILLQPTVDDTFEGLIGQAGREGNEELRRRLQERLELLRHCRREGVEAAFRRARQASRPDNGR